MTFPIQAVVRETGLTAHVLRVWEKRYGAVVPKRTKTERRSYSEADIRRLKLLREATLQGHSIGNVAKLPNEKLKALLKRKAGHVSNSSSRAVARMKSEIDSPVIRDCIKAVRAFDEDALNTLLSRVVLESGATALLRHVIAPLTQRLGDLWSEGSLKMAHEHFATAAIRSFLLNPSRRYAGATFPATLIAATPQGQLHELGAVMATSLAAEQGWHAIYLGASLPAAEIAGAALQNKARAVVLSIIYPEDDPNVEVELHDLRRFLPANVALLICGQAAVRYRAAIDGIGGILVRDLTQLQVELATIRASRK